MSTSLVVVEPQSMPRYASPSYMVTFCVMTSCMA